MTRKEIKAEWPLFARHREAVTQFLEKRPTANTRKISRRSVLDDYERLGDVYSVAEKHDVSPSTVNYILVRAIWAARGFEAGTLRLARRTFTLTLTKTPARLIADVDAWAKLRGKSRREAACELLKIGLAVAAERTQKRSPARR